MAEPTFGGYAAVTEVVSAAAQTAILAECTKLLALIPDADGPSGYAAVSPDFNMIHPKLATQLRAEIAALKVAIDAAPTA